MPEKRVGILGASSIVGECLLPILAQSDWFIEAFSRKRRESDMVGLTWHLVGPQQGFEDIEYWISLAPIWALSEYFGLMENSGVCRIVALSSTSRFTKLDSSDEQEKESIRRLIDAEQRLVAWAEAKGIEWVILRPTLIYGLGKDTNISEIARLIRRFRFFPLLGPANGLRQPVYAGDVAQACLSALVNPQVQGRSYNISGGEALPYREMVTRVFSALGRKPRILSLPMWLFRLMVMVLKRVPRYRHWNAAMAERMNLDMVFDHSEAARDLGFQPRRFQVIAKDLPAD